MRLYGTFEEKGYRFEAYLPSSESDPSAFEVRIFIGEYMKVVILVPVSYAPVLGPDEGDVRFLESVVDKIIELLPEPEAFGAETTAAIDMLETEIGGKAEHQSYKQRVVEPDRGAGQFEYVRGLFVAKFAPLLGSMEAMDQWMKNSLPDLGNRTPEEALGVGMVPEVLKCLEGIAAERLRE